MMKLIAVYEDGAVPVKGQIWREQQYLK